MWWEGHFLLYLRREYSQAGFLSHPQPISSTLASEEPLEKAISFLPSFLSYHLACILGPSLNPGWPLFERVPLIQCLGGPPGSSFLCLSAGITQDATVWSGTWTEHSKLWVSLNVFSSSEEPGAQCLRGPGGSHCMRNSPPYRVCLLGYIYFLFT